jgi:hypothetical protein
MHVTEPLVPEHNSFEVEIAIGKLKRYKLADVDEILTELIKAGGSHYVLRSTNILVQFGIRKNCPSSGNVLLYLYVKKVT